MKDIKTEIENLKQEIELAERHYDLEKLASLKYGTLPEKEKELEAAKAEADEAKEHRILKEEVSEEEIAEVVSQWTGVPVSKLVESEKERLLNLPKILHKRVIGQEEGIEAVSQAILRARAGLKAENRPIGSFIFLGPTGVGKTELAKALSEALFDSERNIIRIDMSEYMEKHSVSRLVGAPPGYVGYDEGGQLTEAVRRKPYSVILFDEIEKAHPDVFNILLQLLDDGRLTDNQGRTGKIDEKVKEDVENDMKSYFRPEFINRIDEIIVFTPLSEDEIIEIIKLSLKSIESRLEERDIKLVVSDDALKLIGRESYSPQYGARPVKRYLQKYIETEIAKMIIGGEVVDGDTVEIENVDETLKFNIKNSKKA